MTRWRLVAVGRLKSPAAIGWAETYRKRLHRWAHLEIVELKDGGPTQDAPKQLAWIERCPVGGILLTEHGQLRGSEAFARWVNGLPPDSTWLLGGPDGFAPEVLRAAQHHCALSPLTFPHDLARVILLEQLYRAQSILHGHPYHRDG